MDPHKFWTGPAAMLEQALTERRSDPTYCQKTVCKSRLGPKRLALVRDFVNSFKLDNNFKLVIVIHSIDGSR